MFSCPFFAVQKSFIHFQLGSLFEEELPESTLPSSSFLFLHAFMFYRSSIALRHIMNTRESKFWCLMLIIIIS